MADAFSIALLALTVAAVATVCLLLFEKSAARFAAMPRRASAGRPAGPGEYPDRRAYPAYPLDHAGEGFADLERTRGAGTADGVNKNIS